MIAVALVHPDTPHTSAYLHGRQLGYTERGWLRCEASVILGFWQPGYAMLTHAAAGLPLPDDIGMAPAHYALYTEARKRDGYTLLRIGPYTQTRHAQQDPGDDPSMLIPCIPRAVLTHGVFLRHPQPHPGHGCGCGFGCEWDETWRMVWAPPTEQGAVPVTAMRHPAAAVTAVGIPNPDEGAPATWAA